MGEEIRIDEFGRSYTNVSILKGITKYLDINWVNIKTGNIVNVPQGEPISQTSEPDRPIDEPRNIIETGTIKYPADFSENFNITESFTLHELLLWNKYKTKNIPTIEHFNNMVKLCREFLQPITNKWGKKLKINSCYRSYKVNQGLKAQGYHPADNSDHCFGAACDLDADNENGALFDMIIQMLKNNELPACRQLIWETGTIRCPNWVHIGMNNQFNSKKINNIFSLDIKPSLKFNPKTFEYHF